MHPNPAFRKTEKQDAIAFARQRCFGMLSINADPSPLISHIPFQVSQDGSYIETHLVRSNPILRSLSDPSAAVIAVSGPDAYISPDWYGVEQQVPTWNYVAVHLRGILRRLPQDDLRGVLDRLSGEMERRLLPKPVWGLEKLTDETFAKMSRMIVPIAMDVREINSTWKLGQNKPAGAMMGAAEGLDGSGFGSEVSALSVMMKAAAGGESL